MKGTVLIVDDNEENLYMLRALLQGHGYHVEEARNGEEALAKARSSPPDLLITDILMPVMDGFTLCREWKKDEKLKSKPFIFYTATYTDPKDEEFALSLGAERFIVKPADPVDFMLLIEEVLKAAEAGRITPRELPPQDEACVLKRYNQRLIQKLEKKMLDLERESALRRKSEQRLAMLVDLFLRLSTNYRSNMVRIIRMGKQVLEVPMAVYLRRGDESTELITCGMEEGSRRREGVEGRFLERLMEEAEGSIVIEPLSGEPDAGDDLLVMGYGFDSLLGCPVRLGDTKIGFLAFLRPSTGLWSPEERDIAGMLARAVEIEEERLDHEERIKNFIDVASHEIRHPVTIIAGYAQTLREQWERLGDEERRQMLGYIQGGTERLEKLSQRLLDVSSIQRDVFRMSMETVELENVIRDWFELEVGGGLGERLRLKLVNDLDVGHLDPVRLGELLSILVDNAVKFSPPASPVEVEVERSGGRLDVAVKDRGHGVPSGMEGRIFEPFVQAEDALHHSSEGMGVGLYVASEIVRRHGGALWHEPREGGGSVFRFSIKV
ncbi:ATP-binding protein [Candidatus Solincola tengchongensis]|uniref:ATP-binding protein n=1 Tax=Candidatus Solincola tengchongensis TaxID=2900693 RepID=UPI002579A861|nr:ATP-binding protein [Candidatus Solincola tengchongensis]